jgi:hypothetical protein
MMSDATPRYGFPYLHSGQAQKEVYHNEALALADMLVQANALSATLSDPPVSPLAGECWIVGDAPSGAWAGRSGTLACWSEGGWRFIAPQAGMRVRVEDEGLDYLHDGEGWSKGALRPDGFYLSDVRIVGARAPAISPPAGGAVADSEARTAILAILYALENHGLIEETE